MLEKYNSRQLEEAKEFSPPFPVGLVPAHIKKAEEKLSDKGNEMLVVTFISSNDFSTVKYYIVDGEFAAGKIKALEKAFNIPLGSSISVFAGKKGVVRTEVDLYNGRKIAKVVGVAPFDPNVEYKSLPPSLCEYVNPYAGKKQPKPDEYGNIPF
jgi:hypothetical protein